jgi:hypothetical protein
MADGIAALHLALLGRVLGLFFPAATIIVVAIGPHGKRRTGQYQCQDRHGTQQAIGHHDIFSLSFIVSSTWVRSSVDAVAAPFETGGHGATIAAGLLLEAGHASRLLLVIALLDAFDLFLPRGV